MNFLGTKGPSDFACPNACHKHMRLHKLQAVFDQAVAKDRIAAELDSKLRQKADVVHHLEGVVSDIRRVQMNIEAMDGQGLTTVLDASVLQSLAVSREASIATLSQKFNFKGLVPCNAGVASSVLADMEATGAEVADDHIMDILSSLNDLTFIG